MPLTRTSRLARGVSGEVCGGAAWSLELELEGAAATQSDWPGRLPGAIEGRNEVRASQPGRLRYYGREPIIRPVIPGRHARRISRKPASSSQPAYSGSL